MSRKKIMAAPSIKRLPKYLHIIKNAQVEGLEYISGTTIANELNLCPIQVRKDLGITGIVGKPKCGYPIVPLIEAIEHFLSWDSTKKAIIVGAGNLATALTGYPEFFNHGLEFVAAFDSDPNKIGTQIHNVPVFSLAEIKAKTQELNATMAVLTVPSKAAQETADLVTDAGIKAIWNFTNVKIKLPANVVSQREDLTSGYAMLCVKMDGLQDA